MLYRSLKRMVAVWLLAGAVLASPGFAADYLLKTWRTDDGLPDPTVTAICQTHDGYLWVGTPVGLSRFDGVRFVQFSASNLPELGFSQVAGLFEDRSGVLWIALESGRLVAWQDGVARVHLPDGEREQSTVVAMAQGKTGPVWLQTAGGRLGRLADEGVEFVADTGQAERRTHLGLAVDENGTLWVGTKDGLKCWEDDHLVTPTALTAMAGLPVDALVPASEGGLWVYADHRLWRIRDRRIAAEIQGHPRFTGSAVAMVEAFDRKPWLAAEGGRLYYLDAADNWQVITSEMGLRATNLVLHRDRENNLWRGSSGGGLTRLRPNAFSLYERPTTDPDRCALSVSADGAGTVWTLLNSRSVTSIAAGSQTPTVWGARSSTNSMRVLFCDRRGTVWGGGRRTMVYRFGDDIMAPAFVVDPDASGINAFFEDTEGNVWIGYSGGAGAGFMPRGEPQEWRRLSGLPFPDVCAIGQAADGAMWFGTLRGGACRLQDGQWTQFTTRDGLPSNVVSCFRMEADGTVWLGTFRGLARWQNGRISAITAEDGLWNDVVYHIADDGRGNFWMSSPGGLFHVEQRQLHEFADGKRATVQCIGYNRNDGMAAQECSGGVQPAGTRTPDGRLWFPTADGLVSIDPARVRDNPLPPPIVIEGIILEGKSRGLRPAESRVEVPAGENRMEFQFTALSLTSPEKVLFRYQLDGLDRTWSAADEHRRAVYRFVPPGQYVFRVMACNNAGVWSPAATLALAVRPHFWQTGWFMGAVALVLAIILAWVVRGRERRKARASLERLERQHAVERERARIAQDIHDDIGASLTQITFMSERVEGNQRDGDEVALWNRRIRQAARRTIESLDEIVWAVSPHHDTLESLANYLGRFAHEHLGLAGISCRLEIPTVLPLVPLDAEPRHNLLLAAREALQNIVAHSGATEAVVSLRLGEEALEIRIADNGGGFPLGTPPESGNGLGNMRQRMNGIGGGFEVTGGPGAGVTVRFSVPRSRLFSNRGLAAQSHRGQKNDPLARDEDPGNRPQTT